MYTGFASVSNPLKSFELPAFKEVWGLAHTAESYIKYSSDYLSLMNTQ